ncbi:hypothetical protein ACFSTC_17665 [Nonomuraea ferruginea]
MGGGEDVVDAGCRRSCPGEAAEVAEGRAEGGAQHRVPGGRVQLADGEVAATASRRPAGGEDRHLDQGHDETGPHAGGGVGPPQVHAVRAEPGQRREDAARLGGGGAGGGDGAGAVERVDQPARDLALRLLVAARDGGAGAQEGAEHDQDDRHPADEGEREPRVDEDERDQRPPTVGTMSDSAPVTASGARPTSSAFRPARVTSSPSGNRRVIRGPAPSTCRSTRSRSRDAACATLAPRAHTPRLSHSVAAATSATHSPSQKTRSGPVARRASTARPIAYGRASSAAAPPIAVLSQDG